jgi:hypothetical protein
MAVGDRLAATHADQAGRLVADVVDAGGAARERLRAGRRARKQIFAVAVVAIGDVEQLAGQLAQLGREHAAFTRTQCAVGTLQREFARLLQQQRDIGQRLLFVVETALDDV